ncbi:MAG TPA: hypothetical protein VMU04_08615 [Candidatus Acidoferrum sp.]|nr:hypothetical protein [Candidatus Acidoferrum sp.]
MKIQITVATLIIGTMCQFTPAPTRAQDTAPPPQGTLEIAAQKIQSAVTARFSELGAACDELQVAVASQATSATPFKVTYSGLRGFKGADGSTPPASGAFIMRYTGAGKWRGSLAGVQLLAIVGTHDDINRPFVNDPHVLGEWKSVDFVPDISEFNPNQRAWEGELYLKGLTFLPDGKTPQGWQTWTKGFVLHKGDQTASRYEIREINGQTYLFFEWRSGDVTIAGMKPHYYVLARKAPQSNP